ncbi:Multidrug resistance-associated protein 4 [Nymphon striatum]|nr:Multidrug resistance-associated protein 4 [Nymphon striatum]
MDVGVVMQTKIKGQLVHIKQERTLLSRLLVIAKTRPEFVVKDAIGNFEFNVAPPSNFHPDGSMIMLSSKSQLVLLIMKMSAPVGASNVVQYEENVSIRVLIIDAMCLVNMVVKTPEMTTVKQFFTKFLGIIQGVSASYDELRIVFDQYIPGTLKETTREKRSLKLAHMRSKAQITPARLQEKECHEFKHLNFIVSAPLQCIVISAILWFNVGALPLIGVFVLIIMIPVQIVFGKTLYTLRKKFLKSTDARIKLIHEIICSMKIIKLYAWEESFWKQIYEKRKHEFSYLKRIAKYHGGSVVIFKNMINVVVLLTMVGFVLQTQEAMSVPNVYLAITMYYSVKHSISEYFAKGLNSIGQLTSSLQRIQKFLAIEEYSQGYENLKIDLNKEKLLKDPIDTDHILKGISFKLHPGNLLCVIGEVGSGKTSLLKTVLEEMVIKSGSMKLRGKVAYACQQSWIFSDTIKNNILFGSKYEEKRYQEVIDACCLSKDINNMLNGDGTIVGERGIRLSGGQRARVSLARTLYHNADIYLLDDPLSAVDNEVGNHIYSRCIQSFLANKITILVTHRVNYLRHAPRILLLRKNDEPLYGTYEDLIEKHPQFSSFYTHFLEQDEISKKKVSKIELTEVKLKDKGSEDLYKLDKIENATSESVSLGVYKDFFRAAGNPFLILFTSLLLNIIYSLIVVGFDYWIKLWTEAEDQKKSFINNGNLIGSTDHDGFSLNSLLQNRWNSLLVLLVISVLLVLFSIPTVMFDISFCIRAARNLHDRMFGKLLHAPIKFFNCEILNRFTKDIGHIDELIPKEYQEVMQFTSVERVLEYGNIKSESYEVSAGDEKPSDNWPENGSISAYKMSLAYDRKNFVLKDISFSIIGGQKVGIVGRTGAGKTSLINAIFRLEESTGRMIIDGIDISKLGLHQLRKKLTVIPQEPLLFQNTIRYNLDPFGDYCDVKIWEALESVEMKSVIRELPQQLDTELTEGSFSLSFGQQQLICLARAVLKENRIIILDEATSNVDVITDKIIQRTIRTKFKDFTVITIAHRIHTIIDADVVVVMDNGKVIELDSPKNLVQNNNSNFYKMIMETEVSAPLLIKQAMESGSKSFETIK